MKSKWQSLKISDLTDVITGGTPSTNKDDYWNGDIPWLNSGSLNEGYINKPSRYITELGLKNSSAKIIPKGSVLIALTGATTGQVGYLLIDAAANQSVTGILPSKNHYSKFLYYYLKTRREKIKADVFGGGQPHINQQYIKDIQIPLPPLDDQVRIANILSRIETLIDKRKESIKALDKLLKSTFWEMFGDIKARKSNHPWEKPRPYLTAQSGKSSKGVLSTTKTNFPIYGGNGINGWASEPLFLEPVVIAGRVGQQCGVIHVSKGPCWVTDNAIVLRIKDSTKLSTIYLAYAFTYSPILEKVKQLDLPFINQSMLLDISIPIPKIPLQNQFASIVEKAESIKAKYQSSLAELENLYSSLSQLAFKGELDLSRVPVDAEINTDTMETKEKIYEPILEMAKKLSKDELKRIIKSRLKHPFSFGDLWKTLQEEGFEVPPAYEDVKKMIFGFLGGKKPLLLQEFDDKTKDYEGKLLKEIVLRVNV